MEMHLQLLSKTNMANKTGVEVFNYFKDFLSESFSYVEENLQKAGTSRNCLNVFKKSCFEISRSMELVDTEQKLLTTVKQSGLLFEPKQFVVSQNTLQYNGEFEDKDEFGTIMPIKDQIAKFLELPEVFDQIILNQANSKRSRNFRNITNGTVWAKIQESYVGKNVIPISLYCDEFISDNSISPHSKDCKLNAFYYNFPTLPDYVATNLQNLFVALLYKSKDVNQNDIAQHGCDPALIALLDVFLPFETEPIRIKVRGVTTEVYIVVPQFYGDNLALNTVFGFNRGFKSNYPCRICMIPLSQMEQALAIPNELLRNERNYEECLCGTSIEARKGVRFSSLLNRLKVFKVYNNISVDIMHDAMLGVLKYDLIEILKYYILIEKQFTIDQFNDIKDSFDYGKKLAGDKTARISLNHLTDKNPKLHANAKEMWTIMEILPLILMQLVPDFNSCAVFKFSIEITKLIDQITKKEYCENDIISMENTIKNHHEMYLTIFTRENYSTHLTFKFHVMLHYSLYIRRFGPLRNSMTFKFEMKHQQLKRYAQQCYSRRNLPYTLCKKFCIELSYNFSKNLNMFEKIGKINFNNNFSFPSYKQGLKYCKSCSYKNIDFEVGDIVKVEENIYEIKGLGFQPDSDNISVYCQKLNVTFNQEINFFEIENYQNIHCEIDISTIKTRPVNIHTIHNKKYFYFRN